MANPLDLSDQHTKFRTMVKCIVENFLANDSDDWRIACYKSIETFEETFPDRLACHQMLNRLERDFKRIKESVSKTIDRIKRTGLTYEDIEFLHYEFPNPDAKEQWE